MLIIARSLRLSFSHLSTLNRYLEPVRITPTQSSEIPTLKLKSHRHLLKNWWSESPFDVSADTPMNVPVFSFLEGSYIGSQIGKAVLTQNYPRMSSTVLFVGTLSTDSTTTGSTSTNSQQ